jgi:uncharacterized protein
MSQEFSGRRPRVSAWVSGGLALAIAGVLAGVPGTARAQPSFDCAQAGRPSEEAICASPTLAELDQQIAAIYAALMRAMPQTRAAQVRHQQRAFLRDRDGCAADASGSDLDVCLETAMRGRLAELQEIHTEFSNRPLVVGGDVIAAPGMRWRPAGAGDLPDGAYAFTNGAILCAVGLPDRPALGVAGTDGGPCQYADGGGAGVTDSYAVLLDSAEYGWTPVRSVNQVPDSAVVVWRDHDRRVSVCRAELEGTQYIGTLTHGGACTVLFSDDTVVPVTEVLLLIAGFEVMSRAE